MILGLSQHPQAACFAEINDAVEAMTDRVVCFNAHAFKAPPGAIVYNLENVPGQVDPAIWKGHECWDFSASNAAKYGAKHVPVGWHPSMERFERAAVLDIDVVFTGCLNTRRMKVLEDLAERGLKVVVVPPGIYGSARDSILARAKLALNMLYYEDGVFPALRVAHLVANKVPVLSERCPEEWGWLAGLAPYDSLVGEVWRHLDGDGWMEWSAEYNLDQFKAMPMVLPS